MNLITAREGQPHVTVQQAAAVHRATSGIDTCIFQYLTTFEAQIVSANAVTIGAGVGMIQGRFFDIPLNTTDSVAIANGTQGQNRADIIVARIEVNESAQTQSASLAVLQGTPSTGAPVAPQPTVGNLDEGDLVAELPLYQVSVEGVAITAVTPLFLPVSGTAQAVPAVGDIEINTTGINPATKYAGTTWERFANGRTLIGVNESDSSFASPQRTGGSKTVTLAQSNLPAVKIGVTGQTLTGGDHGHSVSGSTREAGAHYHSYGITPDRAASGTARNLPYTDLSLGSYNTSTVGAHIHTVVAETTTTGPHNHTIEGQTAVLGSGTAVNTLNPYITVYFWVRTA